MGGKVESSKSFAKLTRRSFMASTMAVSAAGTALGQQHGNGKDTTPKRYPDPDIVVLSKRFAKYRVGSASVERLYTGMRWAEGPA